MNSKTEASICWINLDHCPYQSSLSGGLENVSLRICRNCYKFQSSSIVEELTLPPEEILEGYDAEKLLELTLEKFDSDTKELLKTILQGWTKDADAEKKQKILEKLVEMLGEEFSYDKILETLLDGSVDYIPEPTKLLEVAEYKLLDEGLLKTLNGKAQKQVRAAAALLKAALNLSQVEIAIEGEEE